MLPTFSFTSRTCEGITVVSIVALRITIFIRFVFVPKGLMFWNNLWEMFVCVSRIQWFYNGYRYLNGCFVNHMEVVGQIYLILIRRADTGNCD